MLDYHYAYQELINILDLSKFLALGSRILKDFFFLNILTANSIYAILSCAVRNQRKLSTHSVYPVKQNELMPKRSWWDWLPHILPVTWVSHSTDQLLSTSIYMISLHLVPWEWVHFSIAMPLTSSHSYYYDSYSSRELAGFWPTSHIVTYKHHLTWSSQKHRERIVSLSFTPEKTEDERDEFSW